MLIKILMPALSPTMEYGNITKWLKKEGDRVKSGEVVAEIETDKATMEVETIDDGIIAKILVPAGAEEVSVNTMIAVLIEEEEEQEHVADFIEKHLSLSDVSKNSIKEPIDEPASIIGNNSAQDADIEGKMSNIFDSQETVKDKGRIFSSPLAKRLAQIRDVNLATMVGTGPHGRIVKADILAYCESDIKGQIKRDIQRHIEEYRIVPNSNIRKVIAKRLLESKLTVPHFYLSIECIMDSLLAVREQVNAEISNDKGKRLSVNDFIIAATAKALKDVPEANASWDDKAIKIYNNIDISVAVAIDDGLITPVIKNADQKNIMIISAEMKELVKKAKENSLKPEEFQGGGFTISNLGMYGIKSFNAIVNPPQACILAAGASSKRAIIVDNKIEIRTIMDVNLSCDHRVVDGAVGAKFLASFKKYIQQPILMFI